MEFDYKDSGMKKKIITIAVIMVILCIVIAVVIFILTNEDLINNNPKASSTPIIQQTETQGPDVQSPQPTEIRQPKEIKISYENEVLIFEGLSKDCEFHTVFENNKDYIFNELRHPDDTKKRSWYEINNKSTIYFTVLLDEFNLYNYQDQSLFPDNSVVQKIEITKDNHDMSLNVKVITDKCIAVTDIETLSSGMRFSIAEVANRDFFNYSNIHSRKFMFIPKYQLCKQSDSTVLYYEDNIDDGNEEL